MRDAVKNAFYPFSAALEGAEPGHFGVPFMYLDTKNLVTTGVGNYLPTVGSAQILPWLTSSGGRASPEEIAEEYRNISSHTEMSQEGGMAYKSIATLHLDEEGMQTLFLHTLASFENTLRSRFPGWDSWPADAQLGALSLAWADGPNFHFPLFQAAVESMTPNFREAAVQSHTDDADNPGLRPRNRANFVLFNNAAAVLEDSLDPANLYYSRDLLGLDYPFPHEVPIPNIPGYTPAIGSLSGGWVGKARTVTGGVLALGLGWWAASRFMK